MNRHAWLASLACLLVALAPLRAEEKIVVYEFGVRGRGLEAVAVAAGRAAVAALESLPEVRCSLVESTAERGRDHAALGARALGQQLAKVTDARRVVLGTVVTPPGQPDRLLLSSAVYDSRRDLLAPAPALDLELPPAGGFTPSLQRAVEVYFRQLQRAWARPLGRVIEVRHEGAGNLLQVRFDAPLPPAGPYRLGRLGPPREAALLDERYTGAIELVVEATLVRSEGASTWLRLGEAAVAAGDEVVLAGPGDDLTVETGQVIITSQPRGAVVRCGGRTLGVTPLALAAADEGPVELSHPAALPWRREISAEARQAGLLAVALVGQTGGEALPAPAGVKVQLRSRPPGALVLLDGEVVGRTPLALENISGRPQVTVRAEGYRDWQAEVTATGDLTLVAELTPAFGGLTILSDPAGQPVFVDGQPVGETPVELTNVPAGPHEVRLVTPSGQTESRQLLVPADRTLTVDFGAVETVPLLPTTPPLEVPSQRVPLEARQILWERKIDLPEGRLHLVVARLERGTLVSLTLAPPRAYITEPLADALLVRYAGGAPARQAWEVTGVHGLRSIALGPHPTEAGQFLVRLNLDAGATAKVHESSSLERLRLVIF